MQLSLLLKVWPIHCHFRLLMRVDSCARPVPRTKFFVWDSVRPAHSHDTTQTNFEKVQSFWVTVEFTLPVLLLYRSEQSQSGLIIEITAFSTFRQGRAGSSAINTSGDIQFSATVVETTLPRYTYWSAPSMFCTLMQIERESDDPTEKLRFVGVYLQFNSTYLSFQIHSNFPNSSRMLPVLT